MDPLFLPLPRALERCNRRCIFSLFRICDVRAAANGTGWRHRSNAQFVAGILSIALFSVLFALYSTTIFDGAALVTLILAPIVYLPTVFFMTMFGNVPMNNKLERLDHTTPEAEAYWVKYGRDWTRLNHVRTLGSVLTAGLYIIAAITLITSGQV